LWIFHSSLHGTRDEPSWNPTTGRLWIFYSSLQRDARRAFLESHNRKVVDLSLQPTWDTRRAFLNPTTGRLWIFHSSLHGTHTTSLLGIPQPEGCGSFTPAYKRTVDAPSGIPQPAWGSFTPAYKETRDAFSLNRPTGPAYKGTGACSVRPCRQE